MCDINDKPTPIHPAAADYLASQFEYLLWLLDELMRLHVFDSEEDMYESDMYQSLQDGEALLKWACDGGPVPDFVKLH
jgi:hypothetical protein